MTTGHVLGGIVSEADSQAARALTALGVTSETVHTALAGVPVAHTSDAPPPAQRVTISIGDTTTLVGDHDVAAALGALSPDQLRDAIKKAIGLVDPRPRRRLTPATPFRPLARSRFPSRRRRG